MERKFLEDLGLESEVIDKIMNENATDVESVTADLTEITGERDRLKDDLKTRDSQLEALRKLEPEKMQQEIKDMQEANKTTAEKHAGEIEALKIDNAVIKLMAKYEIKGDKKINMVKALLDLKDAELLENGDVKGLKDQFDALAKDEELKGVFPSESEVTFTGLVPGQGSDATPNVDFSKMTYEQMEAYANANPDAKF